MTYTYTEAVDKFRNYCGLCNSIVIDSIVHSSPISNNIGWNHSHIDAVSAAIRKNTQESVESLLTILQQRLIKAGKKIKPQGTLMTCVNDIQQNNGLSIINVNLLNQEIYKRKLLKERGNKDPLVDAQKALQECISWSSRLFNSKNNQYVQVISLVIAQDNTNVDTLLINLKNALDKTKITPQGTLAKCIKDIQLKNNLRIFDLDNPESAIELETKIR